MSTKLSNWDDGKLPQEQHNGAPTDTSTISGGQIVFLLAVAAFGIAFLWWGMSNQILSLGLVVGPLILIGVVVVSLYRKLQRRQA